MKLVSMALHSPRYVPPRAQLPNLSLPRPFLSAKLWSRGSNLSGCHTRKQNKFHHIYFASDVRNASLEVTNLEGCAQLTNSPGGEQATGQHAEGKDNLDSLDNQKMIRVCDKLIEVFLVDKPTPTDWRRLITFSKERINLRVHFFQRCQDRAHAEDNPDMKHKLLRLGRKLKEIDEDIQRHNELLEVVRGAPSEIGELVARRRKDFTNEFFVHVHTVAESYYDNPEEQNAVAKLGNMCLAAMQAYDAASESIEAINAAELKFQDIINSPSVDAACRKIDSLAEKNQLDSALVLMITKAWSAAKESNMMKDEGKNNTDISTDLAAMPAGELLAVTPSAMSLPRRSTSISIDDEESWVWEQIKSEAKRDAESEPALASYLYSTILSHSSLERSLSFHLGNKLCSSTLLSTLLYDLFLNAFSSDPVLRAAVVADLRAARVRDPACVSFSHCLLNYKGFLACQAHRVSHKLWNEQRRPLALALHSRISDVFSVDIHPAAQIGKGILFDHATGVVIGETAIVGNNCSILHHATLGGTGKEGGDRHPKVGDGVLIGAGATVLGNVKIGEGAKIGAGSVVLIDVPPRTTAVGNPARLVGGKEKPKENKDVPGESMDHTSFISEWSDYVI